MLNLQRYNIKWPKLTSLQTEVSNLQRERERAERAVTLARQSLEHAREQDAIAAGKAIRSGKGVPEPAHEQQAKAELDAAERNLAAYTRAAEAAQTDLGAYMAKNRDKLHAAMLEALHDKARLLAEHARQASALFGELEDSRYDLKHYTPPAPAPEFDGPPRKLTNAFVGFVGTTQRGPARGEIEGMLGYLAEMENEFAPVAGETSEGDNDAAA